MKKDDIKNLELYKEIVEQNNKVTNSLNRVVVSLNNISNKLNKLNDESILHNIETNRQLSILSSKVFQLIMYLVGLLAVLAGINQFIG